MPPRRPRLTPAMADIRRAVRTTLQARFPEALTEVTRLAGCSGGTHIDIPVDAPLVLVALSGGPDSLALAAATAFEAPRAGLRAGAVIVDHQLQPGSAEVAAAAAAQARSLGLSPVDVMTVDVVSQDGPEADARRARYAALTAAADRLGAEAVLLGHTLDDQAETVLLGLARGSGATSIAGMAEVTGHYLRPLLGIRRSMTEQSCVDQGLDVWHDPHNDDDSYTRVRIRRLLPEMEAVMGPGVVEALGRTAEQVQLDTEVLEHMTQDALTEALAVEGSDLAAGALAITTLETKPASIRRRAVRLFAEQNVGVSLTSAHTLAIDELIMNWHGQQPVQVPLCDVQRENGVLFFRARD